jgi:hypothetical protein
MDIITWNKIRELGYVLSIVCSVFSILIDLFIQSFLFILLGLYFLLIKRSEKCVKK